MSEMLTEICVDAVLAIRPTDDKSALDLHMIELMDMQHRSEQDWDRTVCIIKPKLDVA